MKAYVSTRIAAWQSDEEPDPRRDGRDENSPTILSASPDARLRPARLDPAVRRDRSSARSYSPPAPGAWSRTARRAAGRPDRARGSHRSTSGASTRSSPGSMTEKLPVAFLAGLVSVITPVCAAARAGLPLGRLGGRGRPARRARRSRRVVMASIPFIVGFTTRLRAARRGRGRDRGTVDKRTQMKIAGFALVVIGLAFVGLLPCRSARSRPARCSARSAAAPACCSAARSPSARRRASARARLDPRARRQRRRRARRGPPLRVLARPRRRVRARRGRLRPRDARLPLGARSTTS